MWVRGALSGMSCLTWCCLFSMRFPLWQPCKMVTRVNLSDCLGALKWWWVSTGGGENIDRNWWSLNFLLPALNSGRSAGRAHCKQKFPVEGEWFYPWPWALNLFWADRLNDLLQVWNCTGKDIYMYVLFCIISVGSAHHLTVESISLSPTYFGEKIWIVFICSLWIGFGFVFLCSLMYLIELSLEQSQKISVVKVIKLSTVDWGLSELEVK